MNSTVCHGQIYLSPREKQLLRRMAAGKTEAELVSCFGGSIEQMSNVRMRLLSKLGISAQIEITEAAERLAKSPRYHGIT